MAGSEKVKHLKTPGGTSFMVRIIFRQNNSIQGELCWLESDKTVRFRSFMEMAALMQEAMEKDGMPRTDQKFRSWDDSEEDLKQNTVPANRPC